MTLKENIWLAACILSAAYLIFYIIYASFKRRTAFQPESEYSFVPQPSEFLQEETLRGARRRADSSVSFSTGRLTAAMAMSIGGRQSQQDRVSIFPTAFGGQIGAAAVLCDGMGGLAGGERASSAAAELLGTALGSGQPINTLFSAMEEAMLNANDRVGSLCGENGERLNCGTTALMAAVTESQLLWCSAGDSRIYVYRGGNIYQLTTDQIFMLRLMEEVSAGNISREEALAHPKRDALISFIGSGEHLIIDSAAAPTPLLPGDVVLLTSDGLYRALSDREIADIIGSFGSSVESAASALVETAIERGGRRQDNTTVAMIRIN